MNLVLEYGPVWQGCRINHYPLKTLSYENGHKCRIVQPSVVPCITHISPHQLSRRSLISEPFKKEMYGYSSYYIKNIIPQTQTSIKYEIHTTKNHLLNLHRVNKLFDQIARQR